MHAQVEWPDTVAVRGLHIFQSRQTQLILSRSCLRPSRNAMVQASDENPIPESSRHDRGARARGPEHLRKPQSLLLSQQHGIPRRRKSEKKIAGQICRSAQKELDAVATSAGSQFYTRSVGA